MRYLWKNIFHTKLSCPAISESTLERKSLDVTFMDLEKKTFSSPWSLHVTEICGSAFYGKEALNKYQIVNTGVKTMFVFVKKYFLKKSV